MAAAGEDDIGTREYRHGDDLRRVHWRSTARTGELMVRREEQVWQSRATILLDTRAIAHRGDGPASSFEWAVSSAASIALHMARHGYAVRLLTETGQAVTAAAHDSSAVGLDFEGMLLDALAVVEMSNAATLSGANAMLRQGGGDSLVIAVLGDLSGDDASELARVRHSTTSGVAFAMDTASWLGGKPMAQAQARFVGSAQVLRVGGWRVVEVEPGDRLPELWELAARRGARVLRAGRGGNGGGAMSGDGDHEGTDAMTGRLRIGIAAAVALLLTSSGLLRLLAAGLVGLADRAGGDRGHRLRRAVPPADPAPAAGGAGPGRRRVLVRHGAAGARRGVRRRPADLGGVPQARRPVLHRRARHPRHLRRRPGHRRASPRSWCSR